VLVFCHWVWFLVPHGSLAYVLIRRPERFASAAARMYAVFDLGAIFYWVIPTAPPWWASAQGLLPERALYVRRMMVEYGPEFWGDLWEPLYDVLGGNPLAAMPSLHFATSLMAARVLRETGPVAGAVGASYAGMLGLALVYLGEHYLVDLLGGIALEEAVNAAAPRAVPAARRVSRLLEGLRVRASG
jgi:membrane-associated phospholipid phosphatase